MVSLEEEIFLLKNENTDIKNELTKIDVISFKVKDFNKDNYNINIINDLKNELKNAKELNKKYQLNILELSNNNNQILYKLNGHIDNIIEINDDTISINNLKNRISHLEYTKENLNNIIKNKEYD